MFFLISTPGVVIIFFVDIVRQLHLGMDNYISAGVCEIFNFIWTVVACVVFGFKLGWGFEGVLWGIPVGQGLGFVGYLLNFRFNKNFKKLPAIFTCEDFTCRKKDKKYFFRI